MTLTGRSKPDRQDAGRSAIQEFPTAPVTTPYLDRQSTMRLTS